MSDGNIVEGNIIIDQSSFVYKDGVKICRVTATGTLLFHDKDKRRSAERGTNQIELTVADLARITEPKPPPSPPPPTAVSGEDIDNNPK